MCHTFIFIFLLYILYIYKRGSKRLNYYFVISTHEVYISLTCKLCLYLCQMTLTLLNIFNFVYLDVLIYKFFNCAKNNNL